MTMARNMRTGKLRQVTLSARSVRRSKKYVGDSTNGLQTTSLYKGTRDFDLDASMPAIGLCSGALYVQPWNGGSVLGGHPWFYPFFTVSAATDGHRQMGVLASQGSAYTAYSVHDVAPADDDGDTPATTYPGEVKSSDCRDTMEFCIPQGADSWPSNGTGGVVQMGNSGNDAIRRCVCASFPSVSGFAYNATNAARTWHYWQYIPGEKTGTRHGYGAFSILARRRDIPAPGGADKYSTAQIQIQRQSYNGSLTGLSGTSASTPIATAGNWTNVGSVIPTGTDYTYQTYTMTPAGAVHGIGILGTGANYNVAACARGFAIGGVSAYFDGVSAGLRTGLMTRGGLKADSLNDAVHDGSATDPQRVILESTAPDSITLTFGINDSGASVSAADFVAEITTFYDRVSVYMPNMLIEFRGQHMGVMTDARKTLMRAYLYGVKEAARSRPNLVVTDLGRASDWTPASYYDSGVHLNTNDSGLDFFVRHTRKFFRRDPDRHGRGRHAA